MTGNYSCNVNKQKQRDRFRHLANVTWAVTGHMIIVRVTWSITLWFDWFFLIIIMAGGGGQNKHNILIIIQKRIWQECQVFKYKPPQKTTKNMLLIYILTWHEQGGTATHLIFFYHQPPINNLTETITKSVIGHDIVFVEAIRKMPLVLGKPCRSRRKANWTHALPSYITHIQLLPDIRKYKLHGGTWNI